LNLARVALAYARASDTDRTQRASLRLEFERWLVGAEAFGFREDDPNHPLHQPIEAPTTSSTTSTPTSASLSAMRSARRAISRNSATATKATTPVVMAIVMCFEISYSAYCLLPTAYCLLPTAYCLIVFCPYGRLDIAAHVKVAGDLHASWIAGVHKVFEDHIDDMLVKNLHVAKRIDIQL